MKRIEAIIQPRGELLHGAGVQRDAAYGQGVHHQQLTYPGHGVGLVLQHMHLVQLVQ